MSELDKKLLTLALEYLAQSEYCHDEKVYFKHIILYKIKELINVIMESDDKFRPPDILEYISSFALKSIIIVKRGKVDPYKKWIPDNKYYTLPDDYYITTDSDLKRAKDRDAQEAKSLIQKEKRDKKVKNRFKNG